MQNHTTYRVVLPFGWRDIRIYFRKPGLEISVLGNTMDTNLQVFPVTFTCLYNNVIAPSNTNHSNTHVKLNVDKVVVPCGWTNVRIWAWQWEVKYYFRLILCWKPFPVVCILIRAYRDVLSVRITESKLVLQKEFISRNENNNSNKTFRFMLTVNQPWDLSS